MLLIFLFSLFIITNPLQALSLKDNFIKAKVGDYIVASQNKTNTLLIIKEKSADSLTIEEISLPQSKSSKGMSWCAWIQQNFPGNSNRVVSTIHLPSGQMIKSFSITKNSWLDLSQSNQLLSTLLNLPLFIVPPEARKRCGLPPNFGDPDKRPYWQPRMVVAGQPVPGVNFFAFRTRWPQDGGALSGRVIDLYLPEESEHYPSYFPYWVEAFGISASKASIRVIDSGTCK